MKIVSLAAARRYARALLDVAVQDEAAEKLRDELRSTVALLADNKDLAAALTHPAISQDKKIKIARAVWAAPQASELLRRLMAVLVENGRVELLPAIEASFTSQWNERRRVATAEIVSAVELKAAETKAITAAFEKVTSGRVEAKCTVEPALLGGVLVRIGGRSYDGTVRGRLQALRERLARGA